MAWYIGVLGGFTILLVVMIVLIAYLFDGSLSLYIDKFGEARLEVALFAIVAGTVPFALYALDEQLRSSR